jgi:hypothetical protein
MTGTPDVILQSLGVIRSHSPHDRPWTDEARGQGDPTELGCWSPGAVTGHIRYTTTTGFFGAQASKSRRWVQRTAGCAACETRRQCEASLRADRSHTSTNRSLYVAPAAWIKQAQQQCVALLRLGRRLLPDCRGPTCPGTTSPDRCRNWDHGIV